MAIIAPSILSADFANLERDIRSIKDSGADWVHVDVMDGHFVPNITIGIPVVKSLRKVTELPLDVHLMIDRPIRYAEDFIKAGADWLTVHLESDAPENIVKTLTLIRSLGCKSGLSIKPATPAEALEPFLSLCDMILVMTVEPGFGGQKFMYDQLSKLRAIRTRLDAVNPGCVIEVDGGINLTTAPLCLENGALVLVSGNAFFRENDRTAYVRALKS